MDKKDGGPSSRVAEARQKVLAIFGHDKNLEGNSGSSERQNFEMPAPGSTYNDSASTNSYNYTDTYNSTDMNSYSNTYSEPIQSRTTSNTYQANTSPNTLKDTAVNQTAINEQWQQYHSAWQNYYQQYYSEYYAKAAQNYLESEKLKNERTATGKVREKRRLRHIAPIIAGATVVLILLFLQYNRLIFTPIMAYVSPNTNSVSTSLDAIDPTTTGTISPEPRLIIPKLNIDVPVAFASITMMSQPPWNKELRSSQFLAPMLCLAKLAILSSLATLQAIFIVIISTNLSFLASSASALAILSTSITNLHATLTG